jgi:lipopolysaccharide export system protein LptA
MIANRPGLSAIVLIAALTAGAAPAAFAQSNANPFQGFSSDSGKPVDVKADSLEVRQSEQKAIFSGNVVAKQGESTLTAATLTIFYENSGGEATPSASSGIKKLEASGGVVVTSKDQKATGASGVFDMATNTARLTGDVVLTQGQNVLRGKELVINMKTGIARVIGGTSGLFMPGNAPKQP